MSWWASIYLALFGLVAVGGLWDDFRDRRPRWFLASAAASDLTVIYLFVGFWHASLRPPLGLVAPIAFVAAMCWELFQAFEDARAIRPDSELSSTQNRVVAVFTAVAWAAICMPAFIIAGISAFRV